MALSRSGAIVKVKDFPEYIELLKLMPSAPKEKPVVPRAEKAQPEIGVNAGDIIIHKVWGNGTVLSAGSILTVRFDSVGEKQMGLKWVVQNCELKQKG